MSYKAITRLYVTDDLRADICLQLSRDHGHYLANVMRKKAGDEIAIFNGRDGEWLCQIEQAERKNVTIRTINQRRTQSCPPAVTLAFAPIKSARLDFIAQKATELGATRIQPLMTRRTIVNRVKTERLDANAIEAAEQSERLDIPTIGEPQKLEQYLATLADDAPILFCDETLPENSIAQSLLQMQEAKTNAADHGWAILIGPEGGFDPTETALIKKRTGTVAVNLGPRILRADTAALSALSIWQAIIGDWF